jgi:hypothetical protein
MSTSFATIFDFCCIKTTLLDAPGTPRTACNNDQYHRMDQSGGLDQRRMEGGKNVRFLDAKAHKQVDFPCRWRPVFEIVCT